MNAVGYVRVSGKGQLKGDSYRRQAEAIKNYSESEGLTLSKIYYDCCSGYLEIFSLSNKKDFRLGFLTMLNDLSEESDNETLIIVESLDRLSRNIDDLTFILMSEYKYLRVVNKEQMQYLSNFLHKYEKR